MSSEVSNRRNIVLTGPPRSGTTLAAYLLSKVENTVSASESIRPSRLMRYRHSPEDLADEVERFYFEQRTRIRRKGVFTTKVVDGEQSFRTYSEPDERGQRNSLVGFAELPVDKPLEGRFWLSIKTPGLFTALLPALAPRFECYAIVRNPLATLASRMSLARERKVVGGFTNPPLKFDEAQRLRMQSIQPGTIAYHLEMMRWAFERYASYLPPESVIRYEDIVDTSGRALSRAVPPARALNEPLANQNLNTIYDRVLMRQAAELVLADTEAPYWQYYDRAEVEALL